jgi:flagellar motor switch protein FliG
MEIIQHAIKTWQTIADTRRKYLSRLLTRFEEVDERIQAKVGNTLEEALAYLYESRTTIMGNIKKTSEELLRCKTSISFWTNASQGTAEVRYPTGSLSDDVVTRIFKHLPPPYITQLRAEIADLPEVDRSNLDVFRSL